MKEISLYIHIPFCEKKCYYCDFISYVGKRDEDIDLYMTSLIKELSIYKDKIKDYSIKTIFFGGGTPSSIDSKYIRQVMDYIQENFNLDSLEEVSMEINPGTLTKEKALEYFDSGINRVSMGLQTTNNDMLKTIGRIHTYEEFMTSFKTLRDVGFDNINVDLIFGLPDQTFEDVLIDLETVTELGTEHISYYALILEGGTPMEKWANEGRYNFPDDEEDRRMYHETVKYLKEKGYNHYEISNFSRDGYECLHNKVYWEIKPYIGVGVGSHSNFNEKRFWNSGDFKEYIDFLKEGKLPVVGDEDIDREMEIAEYCIFGCRLIDGINKTEFSKRFSKDIYDIYNEEINKHLKDGLLRDNGENIYLTKRGLDLANLVEMDFLP